MRMDTKKTALLHKWGIELTEHVDEGVGQQVTVGVGDVTLVNGAGSTLHVGEDDGVVLHLSAGVRRSVWALRFQKNFINPQPHETPIQPRYGRGSEKVISYTNIFPYIF